MGHQAGREPSGHFSGGKQSGGSSWRKVLVGLGVLMMMMMIQSCVVVPLTKKSGSKPWQRAPQEAPHLLARVFYGEPATVRAIIAELGDVARPVRRWSRQGNGAISIRLENERGRPLPMMECGGHVIVEGNPGQLYKLRVRNETDVTVEVLPMVDGLDLETGKEASLLSAGRRLPPRKETFFDACAGSDGKSSPLKFSENQGLDALHRTHSTGTAGSLVVAVFLGEGDDSFRDRPARERRRPGVFPQPGSFPERRYEPMLLPYQYR